MKCCEEMLKKVLECWDFKKKRERERERGIMTPEGNAGDTNKVRFQRERVLVGIGDYVITVTSS